MLLKTMHCLLFIFLISGCGLNHNQLVKTKSFGTATEDLGKISEQEFLNIRNGIIEINKTLLLIDSSKKSNSLVLDKPTYASDTAKRIAASKSLKLYGELLNQLANEKRTDNLQSAAAKLLESSSTALDKELPEETKNALNTLIVNLGSIWVEKKKADAAKEIINAYQASVTKLADLLYEDFSLDQQSQGYLKAYERTAVRLKNASMKLLDEENQHSISEREHVIHAYTLAETAINRAKELSTKAQQSAMQLKTANAELVNVINNPQYSSDDIKNYAKQVQEFVNLYQVLSR